MFKKLVRFRDGSAQNERPRTDSYLHGSQHCHRPNVLIAQSFSAVLEPRIDQANSFDLVCEGVRAAVLSPKDVEMDSSKVDGGEKEDRICHGIWNPHLRKRIAGIAQVYW